MLSRWCGEILTAKRSVLRLRTLLMMKGIGGAIPGYLALKGIELGTLVLFDCRKMLLS